MTTPTTVQWLCQCGRETAVRVWPIVPARVSGPPEQCHPAEGGGIEPEFCSNCDAPIDVGACLELASEQEADALAARADEECDRRPLALMVGPKRTLLVADRRRDEGL